MDLNYFLFEFPGVPNVRCLFQGKSFCSTNTGNISFDVNDDQSNVMTNRQQLFDAARPRGLAHLYECQQVHGNKIVIADLDRPLFHPQADGMVTDKKGLGLMIKTADCQSLLIAHKSGRYVMALHVGWRGNRLNFPISGVNAFCKHYQLDPADLFAVRGPSLGPTRAEFVNFDSEWGPEFQEWYNPATKCMDLWKLTNWQLQEAGIPREQIFGLDICTSLNSNRFFSYRKNKNCGRQASIIWIA